MPRPQQCRRLGRMPMCRVYKPQGVPRSALEQVLLAEDEWEAIRLADLEGLYQEHAAERMGVSRQTFGRILEAAHKKIADALVHGKALVIEGGAVEVSPPRPQAQQPQGAGPCPGRGRRRRGRGWQR